MSRSRPRLRLALRLAGSAVALGGLALVLDLGSVAAALAGAAPGWMTLAVALLGAQIVLSALRWRLTAARLGLVLTPAHAVAEYFVAVLGNTLLPGGVLGDAARALRARGPAGTRAAVLSVVMERLIGQAALALVALAGVAWWLGPARGAALLAGTGLLVGLAAWLAPGAAATARHLWLADSAWRAQAGLSALIVGCNVGGVWAAARAVGATLGAAEALLVIPPVLAAMILPVSINGWGLREAAAAALWPLAGVLPAQAVAASVAYGLAALLAALPGLALLARAPGRAARG